MPFGRKDNGKTRKVNNLEELQTILQDRTEGMCAFILDRHPEEAGGAVEGIGWPARQISIYVSRRIPYFSSR